MVDLLTAEGCISLEECTACTASNCTWTGQIFRPCKSTLEDMEEVPIIFVQNMSDCPLSPKHHIPEVFNTGEISGGTAHLSWIIGFALLISILILACFIFRKFRNGQKTDSMIALNDFTP